MRHRELPTRRGRPPRHRVGHHARRGTRASCTAPPAGYGQTGPRSQWAGHDLNYLGGRRLPRLHRARGRRRTRRCPALTIADSAGGGMHAVMAILAALVRRATTGEGAFLDVSIADGVLALMALAVDEYLATGDEPAPRHGLLTGRYACYDTYPTRDGRWLTVAAIEPRFWANLCERSACRSGLRTRRTTRCRIEIRAELRAVFLTRDLDDWIAELSPADTCVAPGRSPCPRSSTDQQFVARDDFADARDAGAGDFRQVGPVFAGMTATDRPLRGARHDRDRHRRVCCAPPGSPTTSSRSCTRSGPSRERGESGAGVRPEPPRRRAGADRHAAVRGGRRVPGRARLLLDQLRVGRERQPAVLGRRGRRRRSPTARSRRRRCCRRGSVPITGRRAARSSSSRCRSTST